MNRLEIQEKGKCGKCVQERGDRTETHLLTCTPPRQKTLPRLQWCIPVWLSLRACAHISVQHPPGENMFPCSCPNLLCICVKIDSSFSQPWHLKIFWYLDYRVATAHFSSLNREKGCFYVLYCWDNFGFSTFYYDSFRHTKSFFFVIQVCLCFFFLLHTYGLHCSRFAPQLQDLVWYRQHQVTGSCRLVSLRKACSCMLMITKRPLPGL